MTTLTLNSRGTEVILLQRLLHLTQDGIFGPLTRQALIQFQTLNHLTPDGVCGPKTWAALNSPDAIHSSTSATHNSSLLTPESLLIPLTTHFTRKPSRSIYYIAIHYTAGRTSTPGSARAARRIFDTAQASADFIVDDRDIIQCNPDIRNNYCWAVGDKKNPYTGGARFHNQALNSNTISIELCSTLREGYSPAYPNHQGWYFTEAVLDNAVRLTRALMQQYNIPLSRVIRHYDITGKTCPGIVGWNDGPILTSQGKLTGKNSTSQDWLQFLQRLQ